MKKLLLSTLISLSLITNIHAADKEQVTEFRQSTFQVIKWNFGNLAAMAKGEMPYDKAKAEKSAHYLATAAEMVKEGFVTGTYEGSNAKPEIEKKADEFNKHYQNLLTETQKMLKAAGNEKTLKAQVGKIGGTCKSCHNEFKKD